MKLLAPIISSVTGLGGGGVAELVGIGIGILVFVGACVWWNRMMNKDDFK